MKHRSSTDHVPIASKNASRVSPSALVAEALEDFDFEIVDFDRDLAIRAGMLRGTTRAHGLSLGDRACIALAERLGAAALTTDRAWQRAGLPVVVDLIR